MGLKMARNRILLKIILGEKREEEVKRV